jgi:hypothetical protein
MNAMFINSGLRRHSQITAAGVTNKSRQRQTEINTHEEGTNHRITNNVFLKVL